MPEVHPRVTVSSLGLLGSQAFMKHVPNTTSCPAGFGVFSLCEREAGKFPLHVATDSRSRTDNPKKPQATEKGRWPGKKRPRPSKLWGAVLRNRTLQKKASGLPESARGQVGCGTSCATHQPLVEAPLFWTTSLQTFFKPRAQARRLVAPAGRNTQIAPCFCMPSYPRPGAWQQHPSNP